MLKNGRDEEGRQSFICLCVMLIRDGRDEHGKGKKQGQQYAKGSPRKAEQSSEESSSLFTVEKDWTRRWI